MEAGEPAGLYYFLHFTSDPKADLFKKINLSGYRYRENISTIPQLKMEIRRTRGTIGERCKKDLYPVIFQGARIDKVETFPWCTVFTPVLAIVRLRVCPDWQKLGFPDLTPDPVWESTWRTNKVQYITETETERKTECKRSKKD